MKHPHHQASEPIASRFREQLESQGFDVETPRVWEDQIYLQVFNDPTLSWSCKNRRLQFYQQLMRQLLRDSQIETSWQVRETKSLIRGHVYTEFVFERLSAIRDQLVPYALSEAHGRLNPNPTAED